MKTILLQADTLSLNLALLGILLVIMIVFLIIAVLIVRWVLGIPKIIRLLNEQKAITTAQGKVINTIAQKNGISYEEIKKIYNS